VPEQSCIVPNVGSCRVSDTRTRHLNYYTLSTKLGSLGVCAAGLVGIVAFVVVRRTREIAIRMALGAPPSRIRRLVLREALGAAVAGTIAGLVGGRWLSRTLESLLYGVTPGDVPATVIASLAMVAAVGVASAVPLRRAVQLSPAESMRRD
jgi:ABC-type antimicrobial peptide transport system permease subunit